MPNPDYEYAEVFYVLDFDRTLANTDKFHDILEEVIEQETAISARLLREARIKAESIGESFDTIDYLRRFLEGENGKQSWLDIQRVFVARAQKEDLLEPHALELFRILDDRKIPYGIITFGGEAWQLAKIEAAGLMDVPHVVTHIKEKGLILTGWKKNGSDTFIIPPGLTRVFRPLRVTTIVFLDDKAISFADMPDGVRGIYVRSTNRLLISQQGALPPNVTSAQGLGGAIQLLFSEKSDADS
jgi:hypothetical protein